MMSFYRGHYTKHIKEEIRQQKRFMEQAEKRFGHQSGDVITKHLHKIQELESELMGETSEAFERFVEEQIRFGKNRSKTESEKIKEQQIVEEGKKMLHKMYSQQSALRKEDRNLSYQMRREWDWLNQQEERLPPYVRQNLNRMPSNRGIIWKNIWYFGRMRPDSPMLVMTEKIMGTNDNHIHEIDDQYHRVFRKSKNGNRYLVSETPKLRRSIGNLHTLSFI